MEGWAPVNKFIAGLLVSPFLLALAAWAGGHEVLYLGPSPWWWVHPAAADGGLVRSSAVEPHGVAPNRADALNCVINRELRMLDPTSQWLPENGYDKSPCPTPASRADITVVPSPLLLGRLPVMQSNDSLKATR